MNRLGLQPSNLVSNRRSAATRPTAGVRSIAAAVALSLLSASVFLVPGTASAEPTDPQAKAHFQRGVAAFDAGRYDEAIRELEAGYEIQEDPLFLYSLAQAEKNNGNCKRAVKLFKQFNAADVPDAAKTAARDGIVLCAEQMANAEDTPTPIDDPIDEPLEDPIDDDPVDDPVGTDDPTVDNPRKWYLDPTGDALVAIGVVGVGVGVGLLVGSRVLRGKPQAPSYAEHVDRVAQVDTLEIAGAITAGVGGALLIGGAIRWGLVARRGNNDVSAGILWDRGLTGLQIRGRF